MKAGRLPWRGYVRGRGNVSGSEIDLRRALLKIDRGKGEMTITMVPDSGLTVLDTIVVEGVEVLLPIDAADGAPLSPEDAPASSPLPSLPAIASSTEQSPSPASDPHPAAKVTRRAWLEAYLTEDRKAELASKYGTVGAAATAVNETMRADRTVEPYRNARAIEPYLQGVFPPRRKPRK